MSWEDLKECLEYCEKCTEEADKSKKKKYRGHGINFYKGQIYAYEVVALHLYPRQYNDWFMNRLFSMKECLEN